MSERAESSERPTNPILGPHPLTSVMQLTVTAAALVVTCSALFFAISASMEKRNSDLVQIGVDILRVDPSQGEQVAAAREWALDLIDANAGGVKLSAEARSALLGRPLTTLAQPEVANAIVNERFACPSKRESAVILAKLRDHLDVVGTDPVVAGDSVALGGSDLSVVLTLEEGEPRSILATIRGGWLGRLLLNPEREKLRLLRTVQEACS